MVGLSLVTTWPSLTPQFVYVTCIPLTPFIGEGVERENKSDMLPAFKELGCLSLEHLTLFKEDAPAGGSSGVSSLWSGRREEDFNNSWGPVTAGSKILMRPFVFLLGASMSSDFVFTEGSVITQSCG